MGRLFLFAICEVLLIILFQVDFATGSFILYDTSEREFGVFVAWHVIICVLATLYLSLKERLVFFGFLAALLVGVGVFWAPLYDLVGYQRVPIRDSWPIFLRGLRYYRRTGGISFTDMILPFFYCVGIMAVTLGLQKCYERITT